MQITSSAFQEGGRVPSLYTCQGKNARPPLTFHHVPQNTVSLVLIMDDPDVPASVRPEQMFDHWVVFNMPKDTPGIDSTGPVPGTQGQNTNGKTEYFGPCPPFGEHRYFFKLYALNTRLPLPAGSTKAEVERAMKGHIVAEAKLMGRYAKT